MLINEIEVQGIPNAIGIDDEDKAILNKLLTVFNRNILKNAEKMRYYEDKQNVVNIGISIPNKVANNLNTSIGWAAKCVDMLAQRSIFDGFVINGESDDTLEKIMIENDFKLSYEMSVPSQLVHGCGFWEVTKAEQNNSMPVIRYYNAQSAAALWNYDKSRILAGFTIADYDYDSTGRIIASKVVYHTDKFCQVIEKDTNGSWTAREKQFHNMGRPLMEAQCYMPTYNKPFGKSRISKAVMGITDEMQREVLRCAITSELFSAPMRAILGVDDTQFKVEKERLYYERLWVVGRDEEGDVPQLEEFKQASMTPHIEVMRNLASRMAAESSIPVNSLGIIHDNPSSAEALRASMEDLCMLAEKLNSCNNKALRNVAKMALATYENKSMDNLTDEQKNLSVCFKNPYTPSIAAQTDALIKQASLCPWLTELEIFWESLGYNDEQRQIILKGKEQAQAKMFMQNQLPSISYANQIAEQTGDDGSQSQFQEERRIANGSNTNNSSRTELVQE